MPRDLSPNCTAGAKHHTYMVNTRGLIHPHANVKPSLTSLMINHHFCHFRLLVWMLTIIYWREGVWLPPLWIFFVAAYKNKENLPWAFNNFKFILCGHLMKKKFGVLQKIKDRRIGRATKVWEWGRVVATKENYKSSFLKNIFILWSWNLQYMLASPFPFS